jgi:hypothetical protein
MYMASRVEAVALIVIEVETWSRGIPSRRAYMSSTLSIFTERPRRIRVEAHLRRKIERDGESGLTGFEEMLESLVRALRATESGVLAHRPQATAIHRRLDPAGVRPVAWIPQLGAVIELRIVGTVYGLDRYP